jgi:predicted ATP-dependent protease
MRTFISKMTLVVTGLGLSVGISSYTKPGGDVFEVYIGKEMLIQQALHNDHAVKQITLRADQKDEKISVKFYHCGKSGTQRTITLRDQNDHVLKTLNFSEPKSSNSVMSFPVSEIAQFQSDQNASVRLYYSSAELPNGKWLVSVARK